MRRAFRLRGLLWLAAAAVLLAVASGAFGQSAEAGGGTGLPSIQIGLETADSPGEVASSLQILALLTVLSLAPALLVMTTAFTRIVIVFSFLRTALGTPSIPPNQVVIGLSLFLTFYVMGPTFEQLNTSALQPYMNKEISLDEAKGRGWVTIRDFMLRQTYKKDLALFADMSGARFESVDDVEWKHLVPAFILSELKTAFIMGFYIFVPLLVIDLVVASTLMSMGMMMLPPEIVSLPAKVLVFVLAEGWSVLVQAVVGGVR